MQRPKGNEMYTFVVGTCRFFEEEARLLKTLWTIQYIVELILNERRIVQTTLTHYFALHLFWQRQSKEPPSRTVFENVNTSI